jgi:hypothetical protein
VNYFASVFTYLLLVTVQNWTTGERKSLLAPWVDKTALLKSFIKFCRNSWGGTGYRIYATKCRNNVLTPEEVTKDERLAEWLALCEDVYEDPILFLAFETKDAAGSPGSIPLTLQRWLDSVSETSSCVSIRVQGGSGVYLLVLWIFWIFRNH